MKLAHFLTFLLACCSGSLFAQSPDTYYNPFGGPISLRSGLIYSSSSANRFNADTGELRIGTISAEGGDMDGEVVFNVLFDVADDGHFELKDYDEFTVSPEQECTKQEVLDAIPQLTLSLTIEAAEQLIGCRANLSLGATSVEAGRHVSANWVGADGVPNPGSGYSYDTWIPSSLAYNALYPITAYRVSSAYPGPSISLNFLEGELLSYSYTTEAAPVFCAADQWLARFQQFETGMSFADVVAQLGCDGNLVDTTVSNDGTSTRYSWGWSTSYPNVYGMIVTSSDREYIDITFLDNQLQSLSYQGTVRNVPTESCSTADLTTAYELMEEDGEELATLGLVPCEPDSITTIIREGIVTTSYSWQSKEFPTSLFESPNRALGVTAVEGITGTISFRRF